MTKLTDARYNILLQAAEDHGVSAADHYPPVKWLLKFGLIEARQFKYSTRYHATEAGLAALRAALTGREG